MKDTRLTLSKQVGARAGHFTKISRSSGCEGEHRLGSVLCKLTGGHLVWLSWVGQWHLPLETDIAGPRCHATLQIYWLMNSNGDDLRFRLNTGGYKLNLYWHIVRLTKTMWVLSNARIITTILPWKQKLQSEIRIIKRFIRFVSPFNWLENELRWQ